MLRLIGFMLMFAGMGGFLYSWVLEQKARKQRIENYILFLQKSIFAMEKEKIKVIDYLSKYNSKEIILKQTLQDVAIQLSTNTYPNGETVWRDVFTKFEENWSLDKELFEVILQSGNGFFGRSREENISFLKKSLKEIEKQKERISEKDVQERKVWLPVGILGTLMAVIIFI